MGTQIHAGENYRRVVEIVKAGQIGPVSRVHVWMGGGIRPGVRMKEGTPPATVDYDLWIGPAPMRPFDLSHFHFNWRYWWDFGGGSLADFGCHYMDLPFWALDLRIPRRWWPRARRRRNRSLRLLQPFVAWPKSTFSPAFRLRVSKAQCVPPQSALSAPKR